jgi:ribonuclease P protein subunit POP4
MPLTPETLPKHELVGLHVRVVESTDPGRVGIEGTVVRETMQTLAIGGDSGVRQVPKRGSTFEFAIDEAAADREAAGTAYEPDDCGGAADEAATSSGEAADAASPRASGHAGEDVAYVTVDGEALCSRPARRTENGVDSKWR